MRYLVKLLINTLAILVTAYILPGVVVPDFKTALLIALVLSILNVFFKPIFILLTLPITFFSFGLFLLFVNAFMILITEYLITGFTVGGFWNAFLFSLLLWVVNSVLDKIRLYDEQSVKN
ncbi:MAG: phage holin family protein [Bacteroidia bacterium]|nr:phage holin family protein [Bacteroidia bacterium]